MVKASKSCLAFDIETLGVNKHKDLITVIAVYDPVSNISEVMRFVDLNEDGDVVYCDNYLQTVTKLVEYLDNAEYLCSFNGTSFDLPFIQIQFNIPNEKVGKWVLKNYDILEICRRGFKRTFNLNSCLALNNVGDGKTGSGMEAVLQARRGDWGDLESYCHADARLTYELSMLEKIYCCEGYAYRKSHNDRTHDPSNVLTIDTSQFPELGFSYGAVNKPFKGEMFVNGVM
jgi:DNA polymerase elongation subunit (family B)